MSSSGTPLLVQFAALTAAHFEAHHVWASCHSFDYDESWYGQTDEETFRPWTKTLPVDPADGMLLVAARLKLADESVLPGFATPVGSDAVGDQALGLLQPQVFLPTNLVVGFWLGMFGDPVAASAVLYSALGKRAASVFPLQVLIDQDIWRHRSAFEINGFYTVLDGTTVQVSR
jgi:hypothetical protein